MKKLSSSVVLVFSFIVIALLTFNVSSAFAIGSTPEAKNMRLVGFNNLQARSAYQPIIHKQGDRWIAYIGHHGGSAVNPQTGNVEPNGTSIVDVTDPTRPRYLKHLPGGAGVGEAGGAQMVRACNGSDLPNADKTKVYILRATSNSHEVYDVTDPSNPKLVVTIISNLEDTHKNYWECDTGIAYLVSDGTSFANVRSIVSCLAGGQNDPDLRPEQSGESGVHSQLGPHRAAARIYGTCTADRPRPHLYWP